MSETSFGKYRLVAELGQGGMADVLLALAQGPVGFNKLVVVKRLRSQFVEDPEFVGMLIDEARLAARLNHQNIVHTNEVGEINGQFFIAMEYLEGQPLNRISRRATRTKAEKWGLETNVRILADVCAGLHHAHELNDYDGTPLGVVHRDVTPSNIFITYDGLVKLVDFGIAKAQGRSTETRTGVVKGKVTYMPPEQAVGLTVDRRADLFSIGVMLWEAATGKRMWEGKQDVVILSHLINGDVPNSPKKVNPDCPDEIDRICKKALAREPEDRYETALDMQNDLESWLEGQEFRPSSRDLATLISDLFSDKRAEMKTIIEKQLAKLKDAPASSIKPVTILDSPTSMGTPSSTLPAGEFGTTGDALATSATEQSSLTTQIAPSKGRSIAGIAVGALLVAAGIVFVMQNRQQTPVAAPPNANAENTPPPASTEVPAAPTTTATADEAPALVRLTLRAVPSTARFSIDDGPWLENPHIDEVKPDKSQHTVRIEAKGYHSKSVDVVFDKDVVVDETLERIRTYAPVATTKKDPPPPDAPPPPPPPPPPKDPGIFTGNPWEKKNN